MTPDPGGRRHPASAPPVPPLRARRAAAGDPRRLRRDDRADRRVRHGHGRVRPPATGRQRSPPTTPGCIGSRRLMTLEMAMVDADPAALFDVGRRAAPRRRRSCRSSDGLEAAGIPVEVVSDGFGFFIEPALAALGVGDLPVVTARTTFQGRRRAIDYPNGHPDVPRLRDLQAPPRPRPSGGRPARSCSSATARATDTPRATATSSSPSARSCASASRPAGRSFAGPSSPRSTRWLAETLDAWRADPASRPAARRRRGTFFCGPEVWGDGREDPPPGYWPPERVGMLRPD